MHVSHNDAGRSYYQSGGRRQESMGKQREGSDEEEDFNAPSDIRKMFNPYPNLVHENILGITSIYQRFLITALNICNVRRHIEGHLLCVGRRHDDVTDQVTK